MKSLFRTMREHNSDHLHEEFVAEFGDRFSSVNTGAYNGKHEFMFMVAPDFTEDEEKRLDEILAAHDSSIKTQAQVEMEIAKLSAMWLRTAFNPDAIREDINAKNYGGALDKLVQFAEAVTRAYLR